MNGKSITGFEMRKFFMKCAFFNKFGPNLADYPLGIKSLVINENGLLSFFIVFLVLRLISPPRAPLNIKSYFGQVSTGCARGDKLNLAVSIALRRMTCFLWKGLIILENKPDFPRMSCPTLSSLSFQLRRWPE